MIHLPDRKYVNLISKTIDGTAKRLSCTVKCWEQPTLWIHKCETLWETGPGRRWERKREEGESANICRLCQRRLADAALIADLHAEIVLQIFGRSFLYWFWLRKYYVVRGCDGYTSLVLAEEVGRSPVASPIDDKNDAYNMETSSLPTLVFLVIVVKRDPVNHHGKLHHLGGAAGTIIPYEETTTCGSRQRPGESV